MPLLIHRSVLYTSTNRKEQGITVLNERGEVLPEVIRVMELCAENNIIFATGHSSPLESIILAKKAKEVGVQKFVVTHDNTFLRKMTHNQIKECIEQGAYIEYCYLPCLWSADSAIPNYERMSHDELAAFVNIEPEHSFITTD